MKRFLCVLIALTLLLSLNACGGADSSTSTPAQKEPEQPSTEPEPTPQEKAEDIDGTVRVLVDLSTNSMDELTEYIEGLGTAYTADNLLSYAKSHISEGYDWHDAIEEMSEDAGGGTYFDAAKDCISTSLASWLFLKQYLEDGKNEDLNNLSGNINNYPFLLATYTAARYTYLEDAGIPSDEVDIIINGVTTAE